ncbi:MAG: cation diffusion facilitator family transporter [Holosporales bacterium]|jgi:ferrous-iron efflux pump FieF|nr:cation diffusion facilitator family transporter [Holosporales bacterium]
MKTLHTRTNEYKLTIFATRLAIIISGIMIVLKTAGWLTTNALSIQASLIDSTVDCLSSVCATLAVRLAQRPPQASYTFGFAKIEPFVALGQALLVIGSAVFLGTESVRRLFYPEPIENTVIGFAVIIASTFLTLFLVYTQQRIIHRTHSVIVQSDSLHYRVDLFVNLGIIVSLLCSYLFDVSIIDSLFGLCAAIYIVMGAFKVIRKATEELLDKGLSSEEIARIRKLVETQEGIAKVTWIKTRSLGPSVLLIAGICVSSSRVVDMLHVLQKIKHRLKHDFPKMEVIFSIESSDNRKHI